MKERLFLHDKPMILDEVGFYQLEDDGSRFDVNLGQGQQILDWRDDGLTDSEIDSWLRVT